MSNVFRSIETSNSLASIRVSFSRTCISDLGLDLFEAVLKKQE